MKRYVYIFTRQDISPEQQIVQSAHVTLKLGASKKFTDNPNETYFTVVGVRNLEALEAVEKILSTFNFEYVTFLEPDLGLGETTSIATFPIDEDKRDVLMAFNLLTIGRR